MSKNKRVQYNFILTVPAGEFTLKDLMKSNPGVQYITLYKRLHKELGLKNIKFIGTKHDATKRGCPQKTYASVLSTVKRRKEVLV